ncbi:MAG: hypothetical protein HY369_01385 [Candidatus Aenigmarchaeota archaeon]|nr:hypothetical protein [Candidatus Aenigmarchaeota archaeon]
METVTWFLGVAGALTSGLAYTLYTIETGLGRSKPNAASWSVWAFLATLNALTYHEMSHNLVASLQYYIGAVGCGLVFFYALLFGKFSRLHTREWVILILGICSALVWYAFHSAAWASLIVIVTFAISIEPTVRSAFQDPHREPARPWKLWTLALTIGTAGAVLRGKGQLTVVTPFALALLHGSVAVLTRQTRRLRFLADHPNLAPPP